MRNSELSEKEIKVIDTLQTISDQLETISNDQKHIGKFIGENVHSIRKLLVFFAILTIINIVVSLFF